MADVVRTEAVIIKELFTRKSKHGEFITQLAKWGDGPVVLEKRQLITDASVGKKKPGRCRGFTGPEIREIVARWPEIESLLIDNDPRYRPVND